MSSTIAFVAVVTLMSGLIACNNEEDSQVKISNGVIAEGYFPAVVRLDITDGRKRTLCTGTFIGLNTVITAAHCAKDDYGRLRQIKYQGRTGRPVVHDSYHKASAAHDLALIIFGENLAPAIAPLSQVPAAVGNTITYVGYGYSDSVQRNPSTLGTKRAGYATVSRIGAGDVIFSHGYRKAVPGTTQPGVQSSTAMGDSGGPVLLNNALVGVISGGTAMGPNVEEADNAHLHNLLNLELLSTATSYGAKIGGATANAVTSPLPASNSTIALPSGTSSYPNIPIGGNQNTPAIQHAAMNSYGACIKRDFAGRLMCADDMTNFSCSQAGGSFSVNRTCASFVSNNNNASPMGAGGACVVTQASGIRRCFVGTYALCLQYRGSFYQDRGCN